MTPRKATDDEMGLRVLYEPSEGEAAIEYALYYFLLMLRVIKPTVSSQSTGLVLIRMILGARMVDQMKAAAHDLSTGYKTQRCYHQP